ncbi:MAG: flagellar assembly protein FliW [Calditrichia bacterium]|nr:flagellar assembly protein FliW [Calditrichia bacterium]
MVQNEETSMVIKTLQFGEIEIDEEKIIDFKDGLIGFDECKKFVVISEEDLEPFQWLICIDEGNEEIGFPLLPPFLFVQDYMNNLPKELQKEFEKDKDNPLNIFGVITIKGNNDEMTMNLRGPILIDAVKKEGRQIILTSESLPVDFPLTQRE